MASGGVPMVTHHRPRRPHRSELVVLCDVSGSVANFASFTLMLVFALRAMAQALRNPQATARETGATPGTAT